MKFIFLQNTSDGCKPMWLTPPFDAPSVERADQITKERYLHEGELYKKVEKTETIVRGIW